MGGVSSTTTTAKIECTHPLQEAHFLAFDTSLRNSRTISLRNSAATGLLAPCKCCLVLFEGGSFAIHDFTNSFLRLMRSVSSSSSLSSESEPPLRPLPLRSSMFPTVAASSTRPYCKRRNLQTYVLICDRDKRNRWQ